MIKIIKILVVITIMVSCTEEKNQNIEKKLIAENLWGDAIDFTKTIKNEKPTVVIPFSTSNCGYCLIDGYYSEKNYIENNQKFGGNSFHQCLFNPQLDIYTFQKHYKWSSEILTYPPVLHKYHENGFPTVLAFKAGKQVLKEFYDYSKIDALKAKLWEGQQELIPTGELHMAYAVLRENESWEAVHIFPKGKKIPNDEIEFGNKWKAYKCKNIDKLTNSDLNKHLLLSGNFSFDEISTFFNKLYMPITFSNDSVIIGNYSFKYDETGLHYTFPSPFNSEKYLIVNINNGNRLRERVNYLDYIIFQSTDTSNLKLLFGHFEKSNTKKWKFSEESSFSDIGKNKYCIGRCIVKSGEKELVNQTNQISHSISKTDFGTLHSFGNQNCRFPDIVCDNKNNVWVSWEEKGDINLAGISNNNSISKIKIENSISDSYNPKLSFVNGKVSVFYLNNKDKYYRLYNKTFDGKRLSEEILISDKKASDVILPAVASNANNETTILWSLWTANYRLLEYTKITNGVKSEVKSVDICDSKYTSNYSNAWYPTVCYTEDNKVWAAWNQHYPANFGICGGLLNQKARPITQSAVKMDDWETGGYPCIFTNGKEKFIVWEGNAWNTYYESKSQKIKFSKYDSLTSSWSIGEDISIDSQTFINQTPSAIVDSENKIYVVYSGRPKEKDSKWGIYLSFLKNSIWSKPILISNKNETARHPKIISDKSGNLWVSWHNGIGINMKTKLLKIDNSIKRKL